MSSLILYKELLAWRTILDIFMIAAGLFFLYRTLIGLGTWKIMTGLLVALAIFFIANFLDLKGIEWIFGNLSHVAVIALIVIFQPELRKIFERAAASLRRAKIDPLQNDLPQLTAKAVFKMARNRDGAIVVFPGKDPIREWVAGGFDLDGKPSSPLILSIFDKNSPGHDGALIVEDGKFSKFGVRLPLSQTAKLSDEYGTRHHAAMGLAEKSDALVIVVSEERGKVTVFHKGGIESAETFDQLTNRIISFWHETAAFPLELPRGKAAGPAFHQMAASLAVAVFFWVTLIISQGEMLEKTFMAPVQYTASPSHLVLIGEKQNDIQLHLAGSKSDLDSISPSELSPKIDLSKAVSGKQTFVISSENFRLPRGIKLLDVVPSSLELTLAEVSEHEVPIAPQLIGKLPNNLKIVDLKVRPEKVKVLSAYTEQENVMTSIITTPVYLDNIFENTRIFCKLITPPSVQPVEKRWPDVEVTITVGILANPE